MKMHGPAVLVTLFVLLLGGCGGGGGSSSPPPPPPTITAFASQPSWVTTGQSATLSWSVSGATRLSISGFGAVTGSSVQVKPTADTTYVLTASNDSGSVQAQVALAVFAPPTVWFAPIWDNTHIPPYGSSDYFSLFSPTAAWSNAATHVTVFKIYTHMLDLYDDATLRAMLADLKRRHIALAFEWGPLENDGSCAHTEGFDAIDSGLHYAQKVRDLGGTLQYVAFDEPFQHASYLFTGTGACLWSAQRIAQNAAQSVAKMRTVFPDIIVGDIEVLPDADAPDTWLGAYQQWLDAWTAETGKPFAFFYFDVAWNSDWKPAAAALARALRARHIPVGQIYIGDFNAGTDARWVASAEQHTVDVEVGVGLKPDMVDFQSWEPLPSHVLPESDPNAFTYLIDRYFRDRTQLTLSTTPAAAQGQLSGPAGPLAQATISPVVTPATGDGQPAAYQYSGIVPAGVQFVVFGARAGWEGCNLLGSQPAQFQLTDFTLDAGASGQIVDDFTMGLTNWGVWGNATTAQLQGTNLAVLVQANQTMGLNSGSLPFTAAGAAYTFTAHATIASGNGGGGCVIAVFQDATYTELTRAVIPIVPLPVALAALQTDANGHYAFALPALPALPDGSTVSVQYAGSDTVWSAGAAAVLGSHSVPFISTTSLPDANVGSAYQQMLAVTGGVAPYLWVAGGLPPGLSMQQDGTLGGTPTQAGMYKLSLSVVDHAVTPQAADAAVQIVIH